MERLQTGFQSASGPVYSRRGYLLFCDTNKVLKFEKGKPTVLREPSNGARALTFDHQGCILACEKDRVTRTEKSGKVTVLAANQPDPRDIIFAIDGNSYFTTRAGVVQLKPTGNTMLVRMEDPIGVALSANQQTLYITGPKTIVQCALDADGRLGSPKPVADIIATALKTDEAGRIYAATPQGIAILSPKGQPVETIAVPEPVTGFNWGEGFHNLFVTAKTSLYRTEVKASGTRTY